MNVRLHLLVLFGFAALTFLGCGDGTRDAAVDGASNDGAACDLGCGDGTRDAAVDGASNEGAACDGAPIWCAQGGPSGTGVACGGLLSAGTCVGGAWACPSGMVDERDCTCGEPGLSCVPQVCTPNGPVCVDGGAADAH